MSFIHRSRLGEHPEVGVPTPDGNSLLSRQSEAAWKHQRVVTCSAMMALDLREARGAST